MCVQYLREYVRVNVHPKNKRSIACLLVACGRVVALQRFASLEAEFALRPHEAVQRERGLLLRSMAVARFAMTDETGIRIAAYQSAHALRTKDENTASSKLPGYCLSGTIRFHT